MTDLSGALADPEAPLGEFAPAGPPSGYVPPPPTPAVYPVPQVLVSLADTWSENPTFVDITQFVKSVKTVRGRQHELQQIEPGTIELLVDDHFSIFAPWNTYSPFVNQLTLVDSTLDNGSLGMWTDPSGVSDLYVTGRGVDGGYTLAVNPE